MRLRILLLLGSAALVSAQPAQQDLGASMQAIAQALGVSCNYCHSAARGSGAAEPKKDIARQMIAMTRDLNERVRTATGDASAKVECATCHHGVPIPKAIGDVLTDTWREKGVDAAVAQYRDLRERFFGGDAYDFREDALLLFAERVMARKPDDAIAFAKLNLEYYPKSARSYSDIGYAYTRKFDDATAITYYEKALEIEPENGVIRGRLESLKMTRRR